MPRLPPPHFADWSRRVLEGAPHAIDALQVIGTIAHGHLGAAPDKLEGALAAILRIVESVALGLSGHMSAADLGKKIDEARALVSATADGNNATIDAEIDQRFQK